MALSYDGSLFYIYVNGRLTATQAYDAFIPNQDGTFNLGYRSDNG
jgi:Concanavalin A-like lectin/glucanases superfamily